MWKSVGVETAMHVKADTMLDLSGELGSMYMNDLVYFAESKHAILTVQILARVGLLILFFETQGVWYGQIGKVKGILL